MDFLIKLHLIKSRCLFKTFSYLAIWNTCRSKVTHILECGCYLILHDAECYTECYYMSLDQQIKIK